MLIPFQFQVEFFWDISINLLCIYIYDIYTYFELHPFTRLFPQEKQVLQKNLDLHGNQIHQVIQGSIQMALSEISVPHMKMDCLHFLH